MTDKILKYHRTIALALLALTVTACGGSGDPIVGGEKPPVEVPPTLVPGSAQTFDAAINTALDVFPAIVVKDQSGNGIPSVWVKWTASSGKVDLDSSITDGNGRANAGKWTLGTVSGIQTVTALARGVSATAMTAKVAPGPMVGLQAVTTTISAVAGTSVTTLPAVKAVDSFGNGVPQVQVQFAVWSGQGTITGASQTTNENGIATVGSWKLGPKAGVQQVRADDPRTGSTTMVNATALPAPATQLVVIDGNAQTGQANKRLCTSPIIAVRDEFGNGVGGVPIVFTPGTGSGTVSESSVTSSAVNGYATIGAWTLATNTTQTLVVSSPNVPGVSVTLTATVAPAQAYTVCARYIGEAGTPRQRQAVASAIARWQRVIVGHTQTTPLVEPAGRCFPGAPAINETIEDLLVFVQITQLDGPGSQVARAGPCTVHVPSSLPQSGVLQLDSADLDLLLGQGTLDNMVAHEFGHVLGFGTLWFAKSLLGAVTPDDPIFTGASARAQFRALFSSYPGTPVPVENVGDFGTRDSHWRRSVFNNELMQGFSAQVMPMSAVTVGSLGDLGFAVDLTKAEPFVFPGALRSVAPLGNELIDDVLDADVYGSDKTGRRTLFRARRNPLARQR